MVRPFHRRRARNYGSQIVNDSLRVDYQRMADIYAVAKSMPSWDSTVDIAVRARAAGATHVAFRSQPCWVRACLRGFSTAWGGHMQDVTSPARISPYRQSLSAARGYRMPQNRSSSAFFTLSFGTGSRISGNLSHPTGTPAADIAACCEAACALVVTSAKLVFGVCAFSRLVQRGAVISKTRIEPADESDRQLVSNPFVNLYQSAL